MSLSHPEDQKEIQVDKNQTYTRGFRKRTRGVTKKQVTAKEQTRCDFCKQPIEAGEAYASHHVHDRFGRYRERYHAHCAHTAELNAKSERGGF